MIRRTIGNPAALAQGPRPDGGRSEPGDGPGARALGNQSRHGTAITTAAAIPRPGSRHAGLTDARAQTDGNARVPPSTAPAQVLDEFNYVPEAIAAYDAASTSPGKSGHSKAPWTIRQDHPGGKAPATGPTMQASTANTQHDRGSPVPLVPPELLETVARALAAALVPPPRQPVTSRHRAGPGLPDRRAARGAAGRLPRDDPAAGHRRGAAPHGGVPRRPEDDPPVPQAVRRRFRGQRPGHSRPGRLRRPVAGAGHRAPTVTARPPRHRTPVTPAPAPVGWRYRAACRGADLEVFFPGRGQSAEHARQICASCPVRELCLDYALRHGIVHGIWGGLTERDRRALRSRHVSTSRRKRDEAILAAGAAGYSQAAISRAFSLARTSVSRVMSRDVDRQARS